MFGLGLSLFQRAFRGGMSYVYDNLKLFFSFKKHQDTPITHASAGSTSFDGTDDYVDTALTTITEDGTISLYFKTSSNNRMMVFGGTGTYTHRFGLNYQAGLGGAQLGKISFMTDYDTLTAWIDVGSTLYDGHWHKLTATWDGGSSTIKIYFDGVEKSITYVYQNPWSDQTNSVSHTLGVVASEFFNGSLANVGIWSRALSASEVQGVMYKKYADLSSAEQVSLVSWYGLDATSLGSELVTNGDFATGDFTDWDGIGNGWSVSGGVATFAYTDEGNSKLTQDIGLADNKTYKLKFDYTRTSGSLTARVYDGGYVTLGTYSSASDSVELDFLNTGNDGRIILTAVSTTFSGTIDNISVTEIQATDNHSTNQGSISGVTTNSTIYGGNAPSKPRILDSAPDVVDNYGTLHSGTALSFDGTNDYVEADGVTSILDNGSGYSVSQWLKADATNDGVICSGRKDASNRMELSLSSNVISASIYNNSTQTGSSASYTDTSNWHYAVMVVSGDTTVALYLDGILQTGTTTHTANNVTDGFNIGKNTNTGLYFDGSISSPKIFDVALTEAQIQEMYLNPEQILPTGVASSNLKLWLPLQEGSGTTNYDGSGNDNDGTISGATWVKAETEIAQTALIRSNYTSSVFYPEGLTAGQDIQGVTLSNTDENVLTLNGAEYVDAGNIGSIQSVCFWVKPETNGENMINCDGGTHTITASAGTISAGGFVSPTIYVNNAESSTLTADTWQFVTVTTGTGFTASAFKSYSDFNGLMDDVFVYSDTLTSAEVTKNYNAGLSKHS